MNLKFWTWFSAPEPQETLSETEVSNMLDEAEKLGLISKPVPQTFHVQHPHHKPKPVSEKERDRANIPRPKFDEVKDT